MATTQVLVNSGERLQMTFAVDGVATNADAEVTVTVTGDDGTALATDALTDAADTGVYAYPLDPLDHLDRLTVVWSGTFSGVPQSLVSYVDIVGGTYLTIAEIRAMMNLTDPVKFPTLKIIEARQWFETTAESHCGQAFVPRYKRVRVAGTGTDQVMLDMNVRRILSVRDFTTGTVSTAFTTDDLANLDIDPVGAVTRLGNVWRPGRRNYEIVYEYGMDACPDDLRVAAASAIRLKLLDTETGHRPYAEQTDVGIIRFGRPGPGRPTGDDDVDTVLNRYRLIPVG